MAAKRTMIEANLRPAVSKDGQPRILSEIGQEFGLSRERVRQIEEKTLTKLRSFRDSQKLCVVLDRLAGLVTRRGLRRIGCIAHVRQGPGRHRRRSQVRGGQIPWCE